MSVADIGTPIPRVDAYEKATGTAEYVADLKFEDLMYARTVRSDCPRGTIDRINYPDLPDGYTVVDWRDIPDCGNNRILMIADDWPVFAVKEVRFIGQIIALVVGPDRQILDELIGHIEVDYRRKTPCYTIQDAVSLAGGAVHGPDNLFAEYRIEHGNPVDAFRRAEKIIEEEFSTGYQEHIYLEPQGCVAVWEDGRFAIYASTQCPFYVQKAVAHALGCGKDTVRVIQPHIGGGFGGKEHYPDVLATAAAVAAKKVGKPVQLILDRQEDIRFTPKRHPSLIKIRTALDAADEIIGMDIDIKLNSGAYTTCSAVVLQRVVLHATGVYNFSNVLINGGAYATNMVPSDAFRGFGAPQAIFAIEMHMNHLAHEVETDPLELKRRHFYKKGDKTTTGGTLYDHVLLGNMLDTIRQFSGYKRKYGNERSGGADAQLDPHKGDQVLQRGLGISIFNHGCAFTGSGEQHLINGTVALEKGIDDRVRIFAAGVDMGQGVLTTFRKVVAAILDLSISDVLYDRPDTDLVPDSGPTCASRSIMVVGYLLQEAAKELRASWIDGEAIRIERAYKHPDYLHWDQESFSGDAYPSYGWGINAVEVEIDSATFEATVLNIWTIYDVGIPIDRRIVEGQAQGGMIQALGYAGLEKLNAHDGAFRQVSMADYAIPTSMDFPPVATDFVENPYPYGPFGAKGAGELVFDGAAAAFGAAVEAATDKRVYRIPITPEYLAELLS